MTVVDFSAFFRNSDLLDYLVTKQLSHIKGNWELTWNRSHSEYESEIDSYAAQVNQLIRELGNLVPPRKYHRNEDCLAEYVRENLGWKIANDNGRWGGADYATILEQGGFDDIDERNLLMAAAGRVRAAMERNQMHFDAMEESHQKMLATVLVIILYHRSDK